MGVGWLERRVASYRWFEGETENKWGGAQASRGEKSNTEEGRREGR